MKATKAEIAKEYDVAFRQYLKAADLFLHLTRTNPEDKKRDRWNTEASKALQRAEKIKQFTDRNKQQASNSELEIPAFQQMQLTPDAVDPFSARGSSRRLSDLILRQCMNRATIGTTQERKHS